MMTSGAAFSFRQLRLEGGHDVLQLRRIARGALDEQCALQGGKDEASRLDRGARQFEFAARDSTLENSGQPRVVRLEEAIDVDAISGGNAGISPANAPHRHTRSGALANCR